MVKMASYWPRYLFIYFYFVVVVVFIFVLIDLVCVSVDKHVKRNLANIHPCAQKPRISSEPVISFASRFKYLYCVKSKFHCVCCLLYYFLSESC